MHRGRIELADQVISLSGRLLDADGTPLIDQQMGVNFETGFMSGGAGLRTDLDFNGTTRRLEEASTAVAFTYRPSAWSFQVWVDDLAAVLGLALLPGATPGLCQ